MGWFDAVEAGVGGLIDVAADAAPVARAIPIAGEIISGTKAVYHAGSAIYDGVTGDRDGAINHGTQAVWNGIGAIPAVSEAMGGIELAATGAGFLGRTGTELAGGDSSSIPGGLDDLAGNSMVALANMAFGADDSNWIADGDTPQGTRSGEMGAGLGTVGGVLGGAMGMIGGPLGMAAGAAAGGWLGNTVGNWLGDNETLHEAGISEGPNAPTSGAGGNWWSEQGQAAHESLGGAGGGALAGAALGTALLPGIGTLAGAGIGAGLGALDDAFNIF